MSHIHGETVAEVEAQAAARMKKTVGDLHREMSTIRTGKASPTILDGVRVSYYGTPTALNQLSNLSAPEPSLILVQPWDVSQIGEIEKAILSSRLGAQPFERRQGDPHRDSGVDRRASQRARQASAPRRRTASRGLSRRPAGKPTTPLKQLEKDKKISEDDQRRAQETIQKKTDEVIADLDQAGAAKEKEIMEIG